MTKFAKRTSPEIQIQNLREKGHNIKRCIEFNAEVPDKSLHEVIKTCCGKIVTLPIGVGDTL